MFCFPNNYVAKSKALNGITTTKNTFTEVDSVKHVDGYLQPRLPTDQFDWLCQFAIASFLNRNIKGLPPEKTSTTPHDFTNKNMSIFGGG